MVLWATRGQAAAISRRACLASGYAAVAFVSRPQAVHATTTARISAWPAIEYLEPIYELKLSLGTLATAAEQRDRWPALKKRLDKFFSGGPISERNYYAGVALQYVEQIRYDDLDEFVKQDKRERRSAMEETLGAMEALKRSLAGAAPDADEVASTTTSAQQAVERWFALVPPTDVQRVATLYRAVRSADVDRDGRLSESELAALSEADRSAWRSRVNLYGD